MKPIKSDKDKLNIPLSNRLHQKLEQMIDDELRKCIEISQ